MMYVAKIKLVAAIVVAATVVTAGIRQALSDDVPKPQQTAQQKPAGPPAKVGGDDKALAARDRPRAQPAKAKKTIRVDGCLVKTVADVQVTSREKGVVAAVVVREGDEVKIGQMLARLGSVYAKPSLDLMIAELDEIGRVRGEIPGWEKEYADLKAAVQLAKRNLERQTYRAPIDGVVVEIPPKPGKEIGVGEPICRIVNLNRLAAEGFVKAEVAKKLVGREVRVEVLPHRRGNPFVAKGRITFVSPTVNPVDRRVTIRAEFETPVRGGVFLIRPGLIATVIIPAAN